MKAPVIIEQHYKQLNWFLSMKRYLLLLPKFVLPLSTDAPVFLEESKCTVVREGVQCVCVAVGNPEPTIEFYLPDLNITINETDNRFNFYTHSDGHTSTAMIKLREKGERTDNSGPAVNVLCNIYNTYGKENVLLELQQESESKESYICFKCYHRL